MAQKTKTVNQVVLLPVSLIYPNENQPRTVFDREELARLSESIKENGLLQPMTVRNRGRYYELIACLLYTSYLQKKFSHVVAVSAKDPASLPFLEDAIREIVHFVEVDTAAPMLATERQKICAGQAYRAVEEAWNALES